MSILKPKIPLARNLVIRWAGRDSNPRSREARGLQPRAIVHSATDPFLKILTQNLLLFNCYLIIFPCLVLHSSIFLWLPDINTLGTFQVENTSGLVYCGYSTNPPSLMCSFKNSSFPITPGTSRATVSVTTIAGS